MQAQPKNNTGEIEEKKDENAGFREPENNSNSDAVEEDGTPVLDEEDLEENNIDEEEAEDIEWDQPNNQ